MTMMFSGLMSRCSNAGRVRVIQRFEQAGGQRDGLRERKRTALQPIAKGLSRDVFHGQKDRSAVVPGLVERGDGGMLQARAGLRLAPQAGAQVGIDRLREKLDRGGSSEDQIAGEKHLAHAPGSQASLDEEVRQSLADHASLAEHTIPRLFMTLTAGARLGPYEILAPLGAGGMGEVYRARDTKLSRDVAIKVLPAEVGSDPERLRRFEREARSASALNHPNIVTVFDMGTTEGVSWIAMEHVEGETLRALLSAGPLAPKKLLRIATQIGRASLAPTKRGSCTATSSPRTSWSRRTGSSRSWTSGSPS